MKTKIILLVALLSVFSCDEKPPNSMEGILNKCVGKTVVIATGINEGNYDCYKYYVLVQDSKGITYEYIGAKYNITVGTVLK